MCVCRRGEREKRKVALLCCCCLLCLCWFVLPEMRAKEKTGDRRKEECQTFLPMRKGNYMRRLEVGTPAVPLTPPPATNKNNQTKQHQFLVETSSSSNSSIILPCFLSLFLAFYFLGESESVTWTVLHTTKITRCTQYQSHHIWWRRTTQYGNLMWKTHTDINSHAHGALRTWNVAEKCTQH